MRLNKISLIVALLVLSVLPASLAHASAPTCPLFESCHWSVIQKVPVSGTVTGSTRVCVSYSNPSKYSGTLSCSMSQESGTVKTVTATVGGSWPAGIASISVSVGYSVTQSSTMTGTQTITERPMTSGGIWVAPVFGNRYNVEQEFFECIPHRGGQTCYGQNGSNDIAWAYTEQYQNDHFSWWENAI
jgi:hypothetical protein